MSEADAQALFSRGLSLDGISHGFFTRNGGVSGDVYASLNGGVGSKDAPEAVAENRRRMARLLCVDADHLLVPCTRSIRLTLSSRPDHSPNG